MRQLNADEFRALLAEHEPPCISLYQPTHRRHPENQQDPIRFRNLLKEMEASLAREYPAREIQPLLEPFRALAGDAEFWNHALDGLAVFGSADTFRVFTLQRPVLELVVVAKSFHAKPLVRMLQSADRYQVLGLNRHEAKLYEGNRDALDEVELAEGVPRTIEEALGEELTEPHLTAASYGGAGGRGGAHGAPSMHHGHGGKKDEVDIDADRFFRAIDRAVLEQHSRPSNLPLILAALPEHHDLFRKISHNPFLMSDGIGFDPKSITAERLREEAWRTVEPQYLERLSKLVSDFGEAQSKSLGSSDLTDVAQALVAGRVGTLLVESDRQVPGKIDPASGRVEFGDLAHPEVDDLLDDLAELALKMGGDVVVVPAERMPSDTGAVAIYRF
jgi:Bacterial archaeo-eukaryotic release factor family 3